MLLYFSNDDFFMGSEHVIDRSLKNKFEIENALLELGFEDDEILSGYIKAMRGGSYDKIKILREEISFKIREDYKIIYNPNKPLTSTDLSDYAFCPISFAIKQTFKIEPNQNIKRGLSQHEKKYLIDRYNNFREFKNLNLSFTDVKTNLNTYIKDIFTSNLIFQGHTNEFRIFNSKKGNLRGCPDYIFEKTDGTRIVVEEKFSNRKDLSTLAYGFQNNIIQVLSYLYALEEIQASYGYLIYWYYEPINQIIEQEDEYGYLVEEEVIKFDLQFNIVKIEKTSGNKLKLIETFNKVNNLKTNGFELFNKKELNPKKCVNCSVTMYCKHKSGRYDYFTLPYDKE